MLVLGRLQGQNCDPEVPRIVVDLSSNPDTTFFVGDIQREGQCCDARRNAPCALFIITLHPDAAGINFGVCEGAEPSGSLYYQIDCGVKTPVGEPICLNSEGPHELTFCKPGANENAFCITSIPAPSAGPDITLQEGCSGSLTSNGFDPNSVSWTSVSPGNQGDYDYLLSCLNCENPDINLTGLVPDTMEFQVRGLALGECGSDIGDYLDTVQVVVTPGPVLSIVAEDKILCDANDQLTLTAQATGGTPPYNINWSNGATGFTNTVGPGTYTATLTDALGCETVVFSYTIAPPDPMVLDILATAVNCENGDDGSAVVTVNGGNPPFSFQWNDPDTQQSASATGLRAGQYTVTVTDSAGCEATATIEVAEPSNPLAVNLQSKTDVNCTGDATGAITVQGSGGTAPYTYSWNHDPDEISNQINSLVAGTYNVTVTDANGCQVSMPIDIAEPAIPLSADASVTDVACFGEETGRVVVNASGGTAPFQYQLESNPFQSANNFTGLAAGTYTITVRDANGCLLDVSVTISEPNAPLSGGINPTPTQCFGSADGIATAAITGGTPPYQYQWNDNNSQIGNPATGLAAGNYTLTVTDSNNCPIQLPVTITSPPEIEISISEVDNLCANENNGSATASVSGGTPGYQYLWNDNLNQRGATANNLEDGTYQVTVTDANGCSKLADATISAPPNPLQVSILNVTPVDCFGESTGSVEIQVTGGSPGYTIQWNDPNNQTGTSATNLAAGNYTAIVTDANGCTATINVVITQPNAALNGAVLQQTPVSCFGGFDGRAAVRATGGTAPYSFQWDDPQFQTSSDATNLGAGTYNVLITDANGCQFPLTITITEPGPLSASLESMTPVLCKGEATGNATVSATGGTPPYSFQWSDPLGQTGPQAFNLRAGNYTVIVTDNNGCQSQVNLTIVEPQQPLGGIISSRTAVSCKGGEDGSASVLGTGGTPPYTYRWSDPNNQMTSNATGLSAGVYQATITDANGCVFVLNVNIGEPASPLRLTMQVNNQISCAGGSDGSASAIISGGTTPYQFFWSPSGENSNTANGLGAGLHEVTVIDNRGCSVVGQVEITAPLDPVDVQINAVQNVSCFGNSDGTLIAEASGGTPGYTYQWNDPGFQTGSIASGLAQGTYTVTVTDANGCTGSITATVNQPNAPLTISTNTSAANCNNSATGIATALPNGGTAPYSFQWNDSQNQTTAQASQLPAGNYTVTVTDFNGCTAVATAQITEPSSPLTANISSTPVNCNANQDGTATVMVSGGTLPYSYLWNDPNNQTSATATGLNGGEYAVTITDANGCVISTSVAVNEPNDINLNISYSEIVCAGANNGRVSVTVDGGTAPYSYFWDDQSGTTSNTATGLPPGTYEVTVTDARGCQKSESVTINQQVLLTLNLEGRDVSCFGANDGTIVSTLDGGVNPITYSWSPNGETSRNLINQGPGSYTLNVTDGNGCPISASVTLNEAPQIVANVNPSDVSCFGGTNGIGEVTVNGGTSPYSYTWNDAQGQTGVVATQLSAGNYQVTVTDAENCSVVANTQINQPNELNINLTATDNQCFGSQNGSISAAVGGGTPGYQYAWNDPNAQTTPSATGLGNGNYTLRVTDANGCVKQQSASIAGPNQPLRASISGQNIICKGSATGTATVSVSGGTPGYLYQWNDAQAQNGPTATQLVAGQYEVSITDQNGCNLIKAITLTEPNNPLALNLVQESAACKGDNTGTAEALVTGGVSPYQYLWNDSLEQTTAKAVALPTRIYTVRVTDAGGCEITGSIFVQESPTSLSGSTSATEVDCFGAGNGTAQISLNGGAAPYSFQWNDAQGQTQAVATGLNPGKYQVVATDGNGCQYLDSVEVLGPTQGIVNAITTTPVSCFDGSDGTAKVSASGGNGGFTYQWNNPFNSTGDSISNLPSDFYTVITRDAKGCEKFDSAFIRQPDSILVDLEIEQVFCKGLSNGSVKAFTYGGASPFLFNWDNQGFQSSNSFDSLAAGQYNYAVSDANGCQKSGNFIVTEPDNPLTVAANSSPIFCHGNQTGKSWVTIQFGNAPFEIAWDDSLSQTGDTAFALPARRYQAIVIDSKGCIDSVQTTVSQPNSPLFLETSSTATRCFNSADGSAAAQVSGGTPPYAYQWNDANNQESAVANGLKQGSYIVKVNDANGCSNLQTVIVTGPDSPLQAGITTSPVSCFGGANGSAQVTVQGGSEPYGYTWNVPGGGTSATINNLQAGSYTVEINDINNCVISLPFEISGPDQRLQVSAVSTDELCFGQSNGTATVNVAGGAPPYTYEWNDSQAQTTRKATDLAPGIYQVIVRDALGCETFEEIEVFGATEALSTQLNATQTSCFGFADGTVSAQAFGGTPPYQYNWNIPGANGAQQVAGVSSGIYTIDILDANKCRTRDTVEVGQPQDLTADLNPTDITCYESNDGRVEMNAFGGTPNYTYTLDGGTFNSTGIFENLKPGNHEITITDNNNCSYNRFFFLDEPDRLIIDTTKQDVLCFGQNNGGARVKVVDGGTLPYQISWDGNNFVDTANYKAVGLAPGTYRYLVRDANNCDQEGIFIITQPGPLNLSVPGPQTICVGDPVNISATAFGGTGTLIPNWNQNLPEQYSHTVSPTRTTTYTVRVSDENNCFSEAGSITISVRNIFDEFLQINSEDTLCSANLVSVIADHTPTVGPYSYFWNPDFGSELGPYEFELDSTTYVEVGVTNQCGDTLLDGKFIHAIASPEIFVDDTIVQGCAPQEILLVDNLNPNSGILDYSWTLGDGSTSTSNPLRYTYEESGEYNLYLTITSPYGCQTTSEGPHKVLVNPSPDALGEADRYEVDMRDPTINFYNLSADYTEWIWDFADGTQSNENDPIKTYADTGTYLATITAMNQFGCVDEHSLTIRVNPFIEFTVPTGFTPNQGGGNGGSYGEGDMSNDVFYPITRYVSTFNMKIFNRWGEMIFESNDINIGWDGYYKGELSQQDVYVWRISATFITGESVNETGNVTLIWK